MYSQRLYGHSSNTYNFYGLLDKLIDFNYRYIKNIKFLILIFIEFLYIIEIGKLFFKYFNVYEFLNISEKERNAVFLNYLVKKLKLTIENPILIHFYKNVLP